MLNVEGFGGEVCLESEGSADAWEATYPPQR